MSEPWFEPNTFGAYWGAIVGGGGGSLIGLLGGLTGCLLPRGIGCTVFPVLFAVLAVLGLAFLVVGLIALLSGQPYGIWYSLLLTGVIFTLVCGSAVFTIHRVVVQLEQRRMQSEALRHS
jgi:hypothetical protein